MNSSFFRNTTASPAEPFRSNTHHRSLPVLLTLALSVLSASVLRGQLIYTTNDNSLTITGYSGNLTDLIIPENINGLPVRAVGTNAFGGMGHLKSVTIPNSVTRIEDFAFEATGLEKVILSVNTATIGKGAFEFCSDLTDVTIPDSTFFRLFRHFGGICQAVG